MEEQEKKENEKKKSFFNWKNLLIFLLVWAIFRILRYFIFQH